MTSSKAITDIMHAHIADIRQDAAKSARRPAAARDWKPIAGGRSPPGLSGSTGGLTNCLRLSWRCDGGMNRAIWLAYAVFVVGLILIAAVLLGLLPV